MQGLVWGCGSQGWEPIFCSAKQPVTGRTEQRDAWQFAIAAGFRQCGKTEAAKGYRFQRPL